MNIGQLATLMLWTGSTSLHPYSLGRLGMYVPPYVLRFVYKQRLVMSTCPWSRVALESRYYSYDNYHDIDIILWQHMAGSRSLRTGAAYCIDKQRQIHVCMLPGAAQTILRFNTVHVQAHHRRLI